MNIAEEKIKNAISKYQFPNCGSNDKKDPGVKYHVTIWDQEFNSLITITIREDIIEVIAKTRREYSLHECISRPGKFTFYLNEMQFITWFDI